MIDEQFEPQVQAMRRRVQQLYRQGSSTPQQDEVLSSAFEELTLALEELQTVEAELHEQHEEWLNDRAALEIECQRYQDLFIHAPVAYLVTSLDGTIRQANRAATALLQSGERFLVGRSLAMFVPEGQRRPFRANIAQLAQSDRAQVWEVAMQSWTGTAFQAELIVGVQRGATGRPTALYWLVRDQTALLERAVGEGAAGSSQQAQPNQEDEEENTLVQRQFAFLAEASILLALTFDGDSSLAHVAQLAVPAIADACILDIAEPQDGMIRQLIAVREAESSDNPRILRRRYTPAPSEQRAARRARSSKPEPISTVMPEQLLAQLSHDAELRDILGALQPKSALVASLSAQGQMLGSLTLVLAGERRRYGPTDLALAQELARRISAAIARTRL